MEDKCSRNHCSMETMVDHRSNKEVDNVAMVMGEAGVALETIDLPAKYASNQVTVLCNAINCSTNALVLIKTTLAEAQCPSEISLQIKT